MADDLLVRLRDVALLRGTFTLRSGKTSNFYLDVRKAYGNSELLNELADRLWEKMNCDANCVVGYGFGGIPLATTIASRQGLRLTNLRDEPKNHGTQKQVEGYEPCPEDRIIIPDDVFTTGSSLKKAMEIVSPSRAKIIKYGVIVNRQEGDPSILGAPFVYLFTRTEVEGGES